MTPDQYTFSGDATTFFGAVALFATPVLLYWIFRSYWRSPYNFRLTTKVNQETTAETTND